MKSLELSPALEWIARTPKLPLDVQTELAKKAQNGNSQAADLLVRSIAKLVLANALKYAKRGSIPVDDLFSAGLLGAYKGIMDFKEGAGNNIVTHAQMRSFIEIHRHIRSVNRTSSREVGNEVALELEPSETESQEIQLQRKEHRKMFAEAIKKATQKASPRIKRVVKSRFLLNQRVETIATREGISQQAVRAVADRYLIKIKSLLGAASRE